MHHPVMCRRWTAILRIFRPQAVMGPTGIGITFKEAGYLQDMPPWEGRGR